jgi:hypothetical protein
MRWGTAQAARHSRIPRKKAAVLAILLLIKEKSLINKDVVMIGQNETAKAGSSTLRRIVLALLVAALMTAMMAVSAMPAFALLGQPGPPSPHGPAQISQGLENACAQKVALSFCG